MLELVFVACLVTDLNSCKEIKMSLIEEKEVTPQQCMFNGQQEIMKWVELHPNWTITKWQCGRPSTKI